VCIGWSGTTTTLEDQEIIVQEARDCFGGIDSGSSWAHRAGEYLPSGFLTSWFWWGPACWPASVPSAPDPYKQATLRQTIESSRCCAHNGMDLILSINTAWAHRAGEHPIPLGSELAAKWVSNCMTLMGASMLTDHCPLSIQPLHTLYLIHQTIESSRCRARDRVDLNLLINAAWAHRAGERPIPLGSKLAAKWVSNCMALMGASMLTSLCPLSTQPLQASYTLR
jgi:hypothetical protein